MTLFCLGTSKKKKIQWIGKCFYCIHACVHLVFCRCEENCLSCQGPGTSCTQCRDGYNLVSGTCIINATCNNSKHKRFSRAWKFCKTTLLGWYVSLALWDTMPLALLAPLKKSPHSQDSAFIEGKDTQWEGCYWRCHVLRQFIGFYWSLPVDMGSVCAIWIQL